MIPVEKAHLSVYAVTHPGKAGKNNEDDYTVISYKLSESDATPSLVAIVADGVGGHQAGEVAARIAIEEISQVIERSNASQPLNTLEEAFFQANSAIYSHSNRNEELKGMSTTAACVWIIDKRLFLASVGDSRIYLRRGEHIHQLTTDHTWIQEAIESGLLTPDQARAHPNAHLIRRHLGSKQPAITDFRLRLSHEENDTKAVANQGMNLRPGDHLLLCSDGLTDLVSNEEMQSALINYSLHDALDNLIELANARGGHDNITIIGIQVPEEESIPPVSKTKTRRALPLVLLILLVIVIAGGWIYWTYFFDNQSASITPSPSATVELVLPTLVPTAASPVQHSATPEHTESVTASPIASPDQATATSIQATYTPWPTSTGIP